MNSIAHKHPCLEAECKKDFVCYLGECSTAGGPRICGACQYMLRRRHKFAARGSVFI